MAVTAARATGCLSLPIVECSRRNLLAELGKALLRAIVAESTCGRAGAGFGWRRLTNTRGRLVTERVVGAQGTARRSGRGSLLWRGREGASKVRVEASFVRRLRCVYRIKVSLRLEVMLMTGRGKLEENAITSLLPMACDILGI